MSVIDWPPGWREAEARYHADRLAFWDKVAAQERAKREPAPPPPLPVVLIPTQAQREQGRSLIDATDAQQPAACKRLVPVARAAGFVVRVTYAHALMPPLRGGEDWWPKHSVALRAARDGVSAWGVWANGKWEAGQVARAGMVAKIGAREFAALLAEPPLRLDSQLPLNIGSTT